ncbi:MAG: DUF6049 family protein [Propionibacteriaceae bacterium]|nr:DUF6049 family protein [Propionibacteriaceae bacterium]
MPSDGAGAGPRPRSSLTRRSFARFLAFCVTLLLAFVVPLGGAAMAQADEGVAAASITLTEVTTTDTGVTLAGTVKNTGDLDLDLAEILTWVDDTRLETSEEIAAAAADTDDTEGERLGAAGSFAPLTATGQTFAAGASVGFSVTATWADLGLDQAGVYRLGVHLFALPEGEKRGDLVGRSRVFVTRPGTAKGTRSDIVVLSSTPSLLHDDIFLDDHLAEELTGRLFALVGAAGNADNSWIIDPALYDEVAAMADGYQVRAANGSLSAGTGQAAAQQWLAAVNALDRNRGYRLPWGDPDLMATGAGTPVVNLDLVGRSESVLPDDHPLAGLPLVVRPANGLVDERFVAAVEGFSPRLVLASSLGGNATIGSVESALLAQTLPVAYPDGPGPDDAASLLQRRQRAQAEDYAAALAGITAIRLLATVEDVALAQEPLAPWMTRVRLGTVLATSTWDPDDALGSAAGPLSPASVAAASRLVADGLVYGNLVADATAAQAMIDPLVCRGLSQSWPSEDRALSYLAAAGSWIGSLNNSLSLEIAPRVALTARSTVFPATITNNLPTAVRVRIETVSSSPVRVTVPASDLIEIEAGDKVTVTLAPDIVADGVVTLTARLATEEGDTVGTPVDVELTASESAWIAWVVVLSSGSVFVIGTVLRVRTVARKRWGAVAQQAASGHLRGADPDDVVGAKG